jgi:hypothetical protein
MAAPTPKPAIWIDDSLGVVRDFPAPVQEEIGFALYQAQVGWPRIFIAKREKP